MMIVAPSIGLLQQSSRKDVEVSLYLFVTRSFNNTKEKWLQDAIEYTWPRLELHYGSKDNGNGFLKKKNDSKVSLDQHVQG
jgi:hypothetical protein